VAEGEGQQAQEATKGAESLRRAGGWSQEGEGALGAAQGGVARGVMPTQIGPNRFEPFGDRLISQLAAVRCPLEFASVTRRASGRWESGS
jgi:hypothetical protein